MLEDYGPRGPYAGRGYERYGDYPMSPLDGRERRLAMLERENPHMRYDGREYRYDYGYPQYDDRTVRQQVNYIKCRPVANYEEANATPVDMDGSLHVFTDIGNRKIYTKQIGLDGLAVVDTYEYVPKATEAQQVQGQQKKDDRVISVDILEDYINQVVQDKIKEYMATVGGGKENAKPNARRNRNDVQSDDAAVSG